MKTRHDYAHDVLQHAAGVAGNDFLGALHAIQGWGVAESGSGLLDGVHGAAYNLLNTTLPFNGSSKFNSVGVQNYRSYADGVEATVLTLLQSGFAKIVRAMQHKGNDLVAIETLWEVVGSNWGTSGRDAYNGLASFLADKTHYNNLTVGSA